MNLKNMVVLITGASDGIGKAIALRLAQEGTQLALIGRNQENLNKVVEICQKIGAKAQSYVCDIRDTKALENTIENIFSDFGSIAILINNAGVWQKMMPVDQVSESLIDEVIQTNLLGLIHTTRFVLPHLRANHQGAIINIVSKSGLVAQAGQSVYTASKYGVHGFTEVLKLDLKGTAIKVAGVYQGGVATEMFKKAGEDISTESYTSPDDLADMIAYMLTRPDKLWIHDIMISR
ncbi:MAG: SDR family NAD(P)-dependent oxidoreductase [candidate division SR1 bacterium]|nr:MAG: SDR family NAD(P)-dependent oxidoreductase [candidate division SR1 bacterium]